jgi:hypothetical protein
VTRVSQSPLTLRTAFGREWVVFESKGQKIDDVAVNINSHLRLTVAKFAPLPLTQVTKVVNHSPQNKTHLPEINKPQAMIS